MKNAFLIFLLMMTPVVAQTQQLLPDADWRELTAIHEKCIKHAHQTTFANPDTGRLNTGTKYDAGYEDCAAVEARFSTEQANRLAADKDTLDLIKKWSAHP